MTRAVPRRADVLVFLLRLGMALGLVRGFVRFKGKLMFVWWRWQKEPKL